MTCLHESVGPSTNLSMEWEGECGGKGGNHFITVTNKKLTFLTGLGTWVSKNCIQSFKITFFRNYIHKQEEK